MSNPVLTVLSNIPQGQRCRVDSINDCCPIKQRLMEMGAYPGAEIQMVSCACFGGTKCYRLCEAIVSIRNDDAAQVVVEEIP